MAAQLRPVLEPALALWQAPRPTVAAEILERNQELRARLLEFEEALFEAGAGSYRQTQHALSAARAFGGFLRDEHEQHFRRLEAALFPAIEYKQARLRGVIGELRCDLFRAFQKFAEFHRQLVVANASGDLRGLPGLGRDLAAGLRHYTRQLESELLSVLLFEFTPADWRKLERRWATPPAGGPVAILASLEWT